MDAVGLDFETYSSVDLRKRGLDNYVNDKFFRPLVGAVNFASAQYSLDFVLNDTDDELNKLANLLDGRKIYAHNAGFEHAVLHAVGIPKSAADFVDTAVLCRQEGFSGTLELAAQQTGVGTKMDEGARLIQKFCVPQDKDIPAPFNELLPVMNLQDWVLFQEYCMKDASLSRHLGIQLPRYVDDKAPAITQRMNMLGWPVDLKLVEEMKRQYDANCKALLEEFQAKHNAHDLNLNSHTQLIAWCKKRGISAKSFDEKNVSRLINMINKKMPSITDPDKAKAYTEVLDMLEVKQALGGSSLKKLVTIQNMTGPDGRLRNSYMHAGAAATFRTSGRGVQMQNLKRLHGNPDPVEDLLNGDEWNNDMLASNIRQVFTASDPNGFLIVGDFSSVESRGLAYQANEAWKLNAYHRGEDLYKVQAAQMFGIPVDTVTKEQRQIGKVGELACGYGAGADAVREFASKMGVQLTDQESATLVKDWRDANPLIVQYWDDLNTALHSAIELGIAQQVRTHNCVITFEVGPAPLSLRQQQRDARLQSLRISMCDESMENHGFLRVFHGVSIQGRNVQYWKPSERKTGPLWNDRYVDPKTKKTRFYTLYGGKLAGLLTQSMCREIFFKSLRYVEIKFSHYDTVDLIGQFHDEIVVDWRPGPINLATAKAYLEGAMTQTSWPDFPLAADIKHDYRYTK